MSFSINLKTIRYIRKRTAAEVYTGAGVGKTKYYAYESGKYEPSPDIVDKLAEFLQVPREIFYKKHVSDSDVTGERKRPLKDEIFEGDYVGVHKEIWAEIRSDMATNREIRIKDSESLRSLTESVAIAIAKLTA